MNRASLAASCLALLMLAATASAQTPFTGSFGAVGYEYVPPIAGTTVDARFFAGAGAASPLGHFDLVMLQGEDAEDASTSGIIGTGAFINPATNEVLVFLYNGLGHAGWFDVELDLNCLIIGGSWNGKAITGTFSMTAALFGGTVLTTSVSGEFQP